jgi:hypothetical protein
MTITITKGKLTRWIIIAAILFCGTGDAVDVPRAAVAAVACREFLADFNEYGNYSLIDVYEWRPGMFGISMLCPVGFQETLVYDTRDGRKEAIYRDAIIPSKAKRKKLRDESILVSDAVKLAKTAMKHNP